MKKKILEVMKICSIFVSDYICNFGSVQHMFYYYAASKISLLKSERERLK